MATFGVEIHATILSSLFRRGFIEGSSPFEDWIIIGAAAAAAFGLGVASWSLRTRIFASLGLVVGYGVLGSVVFVHLKYWLPMIGPLVMVPLAFGLGLWMRRRRGREVRAS